MIKYIFSLLILLVTYNDITGQSSLQDHYQKGLKYQQTNMDSAVYHFTKVDSIAKEQNDTAMIHEASYYLGVIIM